MPRGIPTTPVDKPLIYHDVPVYYADGTTAEARAEGNNATWPCRCDEPRPLLGRC